MSMPIANRPIGLFDSGIGGLSIASAIQNRLPQEQLIYVADHAHAPYGGQAEEIILARSIQIVQWLLSQGAKAIVVACNTATVMAIAELRKVFTVPIIGVEPGIKPALTITEKPANTRHATIAVLATSNTVSGRSFRHLVTRYAKDTPIILQACPGFAELVESGDWHSAAAQTQVDRVIKPLIAVGVKTLVLGCTHYIFLKPLILKAAGNAVALIDTSEAVARQVKRQLHHLETACSQTTTTSSTLAKNGDAQNQAGVAHITPHRERPKHQFYSTRATQETAHIVRTLWPTVDQINTLAL